MKKRRQSDRQRDVWKRHERWTSITIWIRTCFINSVVLEPPTKMISSSNYKGYSLAVSSMKQQPLFFLTWTTGPFHFCTPLCRTEILAFLVTQHNLNFFCFFIRYVFLTLLSSFFFSFPRILRSMILFQTSSWDPGLKNLSITNQWNKEIRFELNCTKFSLTL